MDIEEILELLGDACSEEPIYDLEEDVFEPNGIEIEEFDRTFVE